MNQPVETTAAILEMQKAMTQMMSAIQQQGMLKELQNQHTLLVKEIQQIKDPAGRSPARPPPLRAIHQQAALPRPVSPR